MLQPREYQIEAAHSVPNFLTTQPGNPIVAMPTGTGKSVVLAMILQMLFHHYPTQRVMVLTHVKELIQQNYEKLLTLWPAAPAGVYSAGLGRKDANRKITFAGIASVAKKAELFGHIDLIFIDEAHLVSPNDETLYRKFLAKLKERNPYVRVVGLTATPWRLGTGRITDGGIFTDVCYDITGLHAFNALIEMGYICPLVPKQTRLMLDIDGVHMRGGELVQSELQVAVDKYEVTHAALKETIELGADRRHWLVFASGVEHACHIADMLNDMGVSAIAIHSKMGDKARDDAIRDFKAGKYQAAVNNNVLTTGFDFPQIDLIVVLRPTASAVLWVQMLGRGTRPFWSEEWVKNDCLVLDFAGNTLRLGPINDPVIPRKKGDKTKQEAPVRLCMSCATYNHASARFCFCCGAEFTFEVKIKAKASSAEVIRKAAQDEPIVEVFKVDHIVYREHVKEGRPPMLKVTYYCGYRSFSEYVCIQHDGFAQRKARQWWRERSVAPFPESTEQALDQASQLGAATHLRIWVNKKYPEILAHCLDGTAFGAEEPCEPPSTETPSQAKQPQPTSNREMATLADLDDDIPF